MESRFSLVPVRLAAMPSCEKRANFAFSQETNFPESNFELPAPVPNPEFYVCSHPPASLEDSLAVRTAALAKMRFLSFCGRALPPGVTTA